MKIMLDAGHGPNTPGKRSPDGIKEYEFNRDIANKIKQELENYEGVTIYFAHDDKRDVSLIERTNKANSLKVDVYISLHVNALDGRMGNHGGIETYVYTTKPKEAYALAQRIQAELIEATGLRDRGVKTANFHVLRETRMTALLIETGFMDSRTDLPKLKTASFRKLLGKTIASSIATYYQLKRKKVVSPSKNLPISNSSPVKIYKVQVGAFEKRENAERLAKELKRKGYDILIKEE